MSILESLFVFATTCWLIANFMIVINYFRIFNPLIKITFYYFLSKQILFSLSLSLFVFQWQYHRSTCIEKSPVGMKLNPLFMIRFDKWFGTYEIFINQLRVERFTTIWRLWGWQMILLSIKRHLPKVLFSINTGESMCHSWLTINRSMLDRLYYCLQYTCRCASYEFIS